MAAYKQVRNKVNCLNLTLKRQYFSEKITMQQGNMKESWKTINQLLNKRSKTTNIESLKDDNGNNIADKREIAETMNKFFCSIGKDLAKNIKEKPNPLLSGEYQIKKRVKPLDLGVISEQNIGDAIGKIKTAKSFGHDNISRYFLKLALPFTSGSLAHLFNIAIETSTFPDSWKIARVTPIFKEGDKCERSNYRPISVLPVITRLFEKLVFDQLYRYFDENGFLSPDQSGFRALHSTVTSLLKCTDNWYSGLDTGQMTGLIFNDLIKHLILLIMKSSTKNSIFMVFKTESLHGSNPTCLIGNSLHE